MKCSVTTEFQFFPFPAVPKICDQLAISGIGALKALQNFGVRLISGRNTL